MIVMDKGSVTFAGTAQEAKESDKCSQYFMTSEASSAEGPRASLIRQYGSNRTASEHWTLLRNIRKVRPLNLCDSFEEASSRRSVSIENKLNYFII